MTDHQTNQDAGATTPTEGDAMPEPTDHQAEAQRWTEIADAQWQAGFSYSDLHSITPALIALVHATLATPPTTTALDAGVPVLNGDGTWTRIPGRNIP